jgi:H+-transporting ATPase
LLPLTKRRISLLQTIDEALSLGVHIKMLTGDAVAIGKELARQLHLGTNIYDSEKLIGSTMSGSEVSASL